MKWAGLAKFGDAMTASNYWTVGIACVALIVSIVNFRRTERRDKRDLFLKVHQGLISADASEGRFLLFQHVTDVESVSRLDATTFQKINRALAWFDVLGLYLARGYLDAHVVMDLWAEPVNAAWTSAKPFIAFRKERTGWEPWRYFASLNLAAEQALASRQVTMPMPGPLGLNPEPGASPTA
jgi:hypothetical protein